MYCLPFCKAGERLLFGTLEECVAKIKRLIDAGATRIHMWPVKDYTEQPEILADEITAPFC